MVAHCACQQCSSTAGRVAPAATATTTAACVAPVGVAVAVSMIAPDGVVINSVVGWRGAAGVWMLGLVLVVTGACSGSLTGFGTGAGQWWGHQRIGDHGWSGTAAAAAAVVVLVGGGTCIGVAVGEGCVCRKGKMGGLRGTW